MLMQNTIVRRCSAKRSRCETRHPITSALLSRSAYRAEISQIFADLRGQPAILYRLMLETGMRTGEA
jgi:hypothetical protein